MSDTEPQNPAPLAEKLADEDPLLDSGSFIEPTGPKPEQTDEARENVAFAPGTVIAAQPISMVAPDGTPVFAPRPATSRRSMEEMSKRPSWLPEDWKLDLRVRISGASAGLIDRYYVEPNGCKFRSKNEVMNFLETGKKKRKLTPKEDAGSSGSPASGKQKKSSAKRKDSSALKPDNVASATCS